MIPHRPGYDRSIVDEVVEKMDRVLGAEVELHGEKWTISGSGFISRKCGQEYQSTHIGETVMDWLSRQQMVELESFMAQLNRLVIEEEEPISQQTFIKRKLSREQKIPPTFLEITRTVTRRVMENNAKVKRRHGDAVKRFL